MTRMNGGPEKRRTGGGGAGTTQQQHGGTFGATTTTTSPSPAGAHHHQSSSHVVRTVSTNPATSNTSSSTPRNVSGGGGTQTSTTATVIAPPPKVVHASTGSLPDDSSGGVQTKPGGASNPGVGGTGSSSSGGMGGNNNNNSGGGGKDSSSSHRERELNAAAAKAAAASASTHHRVDTQALRARDERIASLEKELRTMETEFSRELERASISESETASFWQGKHSAVHTAFLRADTELRLLRAEVEVREAERGELREGWEIMRREAREREEVVKELRGQVRGLKEWVSREIVRGDGGWGGKGGGGGRAGGGGGGGGGGMAGLGLGGGGGAVSDEVFAEGMARLANGLQNWVIVHFRKTRVDLSRVDEETLQEVGRLVPMYEEVVHTAKVHFLQSIVSGILVEEIFDSYFVGLSRAQAEQFRQMEKLLGAFATAPEALNYWRSQTLSMIRRGAEASCASPARTPQLNPMTTSSTMDKQKGVVGQQGEQDEEEEAERERERERNRDPLAEFHLQSSDLVTRTVDKICGLLDAITISTICTAGTGTTATSATTSSSTSSSSAPATQSSATITATPTPTPSSSATTKPPPTHSSRETALRVLLNNSVTLSRLLSSQRARFEVTMPGGRTRREWQRLFFESGSMEDIGALEDLDEDEEGEEEDYDDDDDDDDDDGDQYGEYEYGKGYGEFGGGNGNGKGDGLGGGGGEGGFLDADDDGLGWGRGRGRDVNMNMSTTGGDKRKRAGKRGKRRRRRRREVLLSTFPMVIKMGDEHGSGTERYRNVILRARVLCADKSSCM